MCDGWLRLPRSTPPSSLLPSDELYQLCLLAGVNLDREAFEVLVRLTRLNVTPTATFEGLRYLKNEVLKRRLASHS